MLLKKKKKNLGVAVNKKIKFEVRYYIMINLCNEY